LIVVDCLHQIVVARPLFHGTIKRDRVGEIPGISRSLFNPEERW
jgi:hypothetical protein